MGVVMGSMSFSMIMPSVINFTKGVASKQRISGMIIRKPKIDRSKPGKIFAELQMLYLITTSFLDILKENV